MVYLLPLFFFAFSLVDSKFWYVDSSGNFNLNCTIGGTVSIPFRSIPDAYLCVSEGDTILVNPGKYPPFQLTVDISVTIKGIAGASKTFFDGCNCTWFYPHGCSHFILSDLTFQNFWSTPYRSGSVIHRAASLGNENIVIENCQFLNPPETNYSTVIVADSDPGFQSISLSNIYLENVSLLSLGGSTGPDLTLSSIRCNPCSTGISITPSFTPIAVRIKDSSFNIKTGSAIYISANYGGVVNITNSTFTGAYGISILQNYYGIVMRIENSTFKNLIANAIQHGAWTSGTKSAVIVTNSQIINNGPSDQTYLSILECVTYYGDEPGASLILEDSTIVNNNGTIGVFSTCYGCYFKSTGNTVSGNTGKDYCVL